MSSNGNGKRTRRCVNCKHTKPLSAFTGGKVTCDLCLDYKAEHHRRFHFDKRAAVFERAFGPEPVHSVSHPEKVYALDDEGWLVLRGPYWK